MLNHLDIRIGSEIKARDINAIRSLAVEQSLRPHEFDDKSQTQIPCVLSQNVPRFGFTRITTSSFMDDTNAWITGGDGGHNWVMFDSEYYADTTGVCEVIPYDRPVMLRTGGYPVNGLRYDLPCYDLPFLSVNLDGEFTCVGKTLDPEVFWYIRNAGVGGTGQKIYATVIESIPATPSDYDHTSDILPPSGRIRIYGKQYEEENEQKNYDYCTADFLSDDCDEIIPEGTSITVHGPYTKYDVNDDNGEVVAVFYYVADKNEGVYVGKTSSAITGPNEVTTMSIKNGSDDHELTNIRFPLLTESQTLPSDETVWVRRDFGEGGVRLYIVRARCV